MIFTCHVSGDEIEWGNTSSSNNRIRFDDDAPVGTSISQGVITATLTSKDSSGAKSDYIINVSPGAQFGYVLYYDTLVVPYTEVVMSSNQFLLMLHLLYKN